MNDNTGTAILAELKATRRQLETVCGLVHGLYRLSKGEPRQPPLPGLVADDSPLPEPGEIARALPRRWNNTVKVYEALFRAFGAEEFGHEELFGRAAMEEVAEAASRRLLPQTVSRMMVDIVRAGAAVQVGRGRFRLEKPTDELREAVEKAAVKHPATKEAANA